MASDPMAKFLGGGGMSDDAGDDDGGGGDSAVDAAKDIIAAVKSGDAKALDLALKRHYEICQSSDDHEEPDEDDGEEY